MRIAIDLHNHSCLSPCAENAMLPSIIALEASEKHIDMVALTDHNTTENLSAFKDAAEIVGITPVYGMEISTVEEVHLLSLFETIEQAQQFGKIIDESLIKFPNDPKFFGDQLIVDVEGNVTGQIEHMLYGPSTLSLDVLVSLILDHNGLAIPAHIDRNSNSIIANLGFIPDLPYSAVEIVNIPVEEDVSKWAVLQGSDAHYINHIGRRFCYIEADEPTFAGLRNALITKQISYRR
ncbi:MAG: PHP domain-containing protein [Sphaerochaetaceae bacterium]|nr:PHP domain-containing protein [Sphaerochaetaceae bacterium]